jgi:hypothetical protein
LVEPASNEDDTMAAAVSSSSSSSSSVAPFKEYEGCTACFGMDGSAAENPLVQCEGCLGWVHALCGRVSAAVLADEQSRWFCSGCASKCQQLATGSSTCALCPVTLPAVMVCDANGVLVHQACVMHLPVFNYNFATGAFKAIGYDDVAAPPSTTTTACGYCHQLKGALVQCSNGHHTALSRKRSAFHPLCRLYGADNQRPPMWIFPNASLMRGRRADENVFKSIDFRQQTATLRVCLCETHRAEATTTMIANLEALEVQKARKRLLMQVAPEPKPPAEMLMMMQDDTSSGSSSSVPSSSATAAAAPHDATAAAQAEKVTTLETRVNELTRQVQLQQQERAQHGAAAEQERTRFMHHIAQLEARHISSATSIQQLQNTNRQFAETHQQSQHTIAQLVTQLQAYDQYVRSQQPVAAPQR